MTGVSAPEGQLPGLAWAERAVGPSATSTVFAATRPDHIRVGQNPMSALPPKADIGTQTRDVRFVPQADILRRTKIVPFVDHLVGAQPAALAKGH